MRWSWPGLFVSIVGSVAATLVATLLVVPAILYWAGCPDVAADVFDRCPDDTPPRPQISLFALANLDPNPVEVGPQGNSSVSLVMKNPSGSDDRDVRWPCSKVKIFWSTELGTIQEPLRQPDGKDIWVEVEGPTDSYLVRWVAPSQASDAVRLSATLVDCHGTEWTAHYIFQVRV